MASNVKRAYTACPGFLLAFLTRLQESRFDRDPRKRANARRERVPARRLKTKVAFGLRERFSSRLHQAERSADAPNPYLTVGPDRHETSRDCDTNGTSSFSCVTP